MLTADGQFLVGISDDAVVWWDLATGEEGVLFDAPGASEVQFSDGLETAGLRNRNGLFVSGTTTDGWVQLSDSFAPFDIAPDGSRVAFVVDSAVTIADLRDDERVRLPTDGVRVVRFSTGGDQVAVVAEDGVSVWGLDGSEVGRLTSPAYRWTGEVTFAASDQELLVSSRFGVVLVDVPSGT